MYRCLLLLLAAAAAVALPACDEDLPPDFVVTCDITTRGCQGAIFNSVVAEVGFDGAVLPPVRVLTLQQYENELRAFTPPEDDGVETRALRLFGFVPETSESLNEDGIRLRLEGVAAFYCAPRGCAPDGLITIIDRDYETFEGNLILAHEYVHALQEQEFGFQSIFDGATTSDVTLVRRSLIEGDAEFISFSWAFNAAGAPLSTMDFDGFHRDRIDRVIELAGSPMSPFFNSVFTFPYGYGFDFMTAAAETGVRASLYDMPPETSLAFMFGYDALLDGVVPGLSVVEAAHPAPPEGQEMLEDDRLGAWYVYSALARREVPADDAWGHALFWLGDRFEVWQGEGDELTALWRIRYDDLAAVNATANAFGDGFVTTVIGDDVLLIASESDATLSAWVDAL